MLNWGIHFFGVEEGAVNGSALSRNEKAPPVLTNSP